MLTPICIGSTSLLSPSWWLQSFIHFPFIHLQVQPKDLEIVVMWCTKYLLNYRCQMIEHNYNTVITQQNINYIIKSL